MGPLTFVRLLLECGSNPFRAVSADVARPSLKLTDRNNMETVFPESTNKPFSTLSRVSLGEC